MTDVGSLSEVCPSAEHWGLFPPEHLRPLAQILQEVDYARLSVQPWFQTRHQMPGMDWQYTHSRLIGPPRPLACHSHPQRYWSDLSDSLARAQQFFWLHQADTQLAQRLGPLAHDSHSLLQVAVLTTAGGSPRYLLSSVSQRSPGQFVYLGDDTGLLIESAWRRWRRSQRLPRFGRLLDLCCGSGAVSLALGEHFEETIGSDLNPSAIGLAHSALELHRQLGQPCPHSRFVCAPNFQGVQGRFDWIVGNPPALPGVTASNLYAYGGQSSTALTLALTAELPDRLQPNGTALFLTFSPGRRLWEQLSQSLPRQLSLRYQVRARFACSVQSEGKKFPFLDHVFVEISNDGQGGRRFLSNWLQRRLSAWMIQRPQPPGYLSRLPP